MCFGLVLILLSLYISGLAATNQNDPFRTSSGHLSTINLENLEMNLLK